MNPQELRSKLSSGVIAFPVTTFKPDLSLDLDGLRRNLRAMVKHRLTAIVAAGGTGELHTLSPAEALSVLRVTMEVSAGRIPVLAAVGFNAAIATEHARAAASAGASGILAFPPYYGQPDEAGLFEYYRAIGTATDLGLVIYSRDWAAFSAAQVERLTQIPTLVAWKDGQGDIRRYQMIRQRVGDRLCWIGGAGDDLVGAYYGLGVRTYTSSIANVTPKLSLKLHELASKGDTAALAPVMNDLIVPLYALRAKRKGYEVSTMKSLMDLLGMTGGPVRPPLVNLCTEEMAQLKQQVEKWKQWV
jgi:5-dehydro-4-deoxyglucarate dehydratase